ncbi:thiolase family protein [Kocuria palustris]|uniref:Probable acetyl-CoA acetyltransferase n=1 Tax=Kocuria palustris PEL TaxID=1236550 RepID=M2YGW6_9MICC|nr:MULTISPECIES: thiolase family protein [Kocuria]ALB03721.1 beta-ketoadipyl CoA thiolase [Kocuria palustris]EME37759.1 3-ketoacyl-CoA thiolase Acetyl-CoA acetyltransferase [Kocuria palustris PEL]MCT1835452.1 thiolase family protein [Kocuria palustris]MCY1684273.1 thiolase family protein [Kocuria sp. SL71]PZO68812.1 MAG: acetyl-CoA C-acyltransferase [Kocuria palustris]
MSTAASGRQDAYIYDAVRTPFAKIGGALSGHRPDDLAALVVRSMVERAEGLDPESIDEVVFGNANGAGEENRNVARMATLLAGLPTSLPGTTVNRLCGSSLDAAMMASRQIEVDEADLMLVGGVESMSRAPWVLPKTERPFPMQDLHLANTTLGWRLVNPEMPDAWTVSLGEATEQLREKHGITREEQDVFSARSHQLAAKAWDEGRYDDLTVTVKANSKRGSDVTRDETVRADSTPETLGGLRTVFRKDNGTVTAGNASPMNDGASAAWLGSEKAAVLLGRTPLARIAGRGAAANEPQFFGEAPVEAANLALKRAGIGWEDVSAVELNEAFAAQSLACLRQWGIEESIVNAWGGAIAIGHPLGASGTRVLGTLARRLRAEGGRWGVASLCIGVGQGLAVVLENTDAA